MRAFEWYVIDSVNGQPIYSIRSVGEDATSAESVLLNKLQSRQLSNDFAQALVRADQAGDNSYPRRAQEIMARRYAQSEGLLIVEDIYI